jgi:hypothetical protein
MGIHAFECFYPRLSTAIHGYSRLWESRERASFSALECGLGGVTSGTNDRIAPRRSAVRIRLAPSPRSPCKWGKSHCGERLEPAADSPHFRH